MKKLIALTMLAGAFVSLNACSKPDCDKAVAHTYKLLGEDAAKLPEEQKKALEAALPKQKTEALEECKSGKPRPLTADRYKCIMAAKAKADLEKCAN